MLDLLRRLCLLQRPWGSGLGDLVLPTSSGAWPSLFPLIGIIPPLTSVYLAHQKFLNCSGIHFVVVCLECLLVAACRASNHGLEGTGLLLGHQLLLGELFHPLLFRFLPAVSSFLDFCTSQMRELGFGLDIVGLRPEAVLEGF